MLFSSSLLASPLHPFMLFFHFPGKLSFSLSSLSSFFLSFPFTSWPSHFFPLHLALVIAGTLCLATEARGREMGKVAISPNKIKIRG